MQNVGNIKPKVAVHKFSSCDGCQLAFLNLGEDLLTLSELVDIVHFAEAGPVNEEISVDIAFVEGSISTPGDIERIQRVREKSKYLISIGACATAGGIQALRNMVDADAWVSGIYAAPEYIKSLATSNAIKQHVRVDFELWGCPVTSRQVVAIVRSLLSGVVPEKDRNKVCMECKRKQTVCILVARGEPCMGPVTATGCGALCPSFGRDCFGCFGPAENVNGNSLSQCMAGLGLATQAIAHRFWFINAGAEEFNAAGKTASNITDDWTPY